MRYDFSSVEDIESFVSIPEGRYLCRIAEVREGLSRDGSARWTMRLEVAEGDYAGRTAGWDGLTWSERGLPRVKRFLEVLGLDTRGVVDVESSDLVGRHVVAVFLEEEREDPLSGRRTLRLRVPYSGYSAAEGALGEAS